MKTTLKTLICTALCCAAWSAFAAPAPTTTAMAFKAAAGCAGPSVGSVSLSGNSDPDVYIQSTTTVTSSGLPVTSGFAQVQIATDGLGNPVSAGFPGVCWIAIAQMDVDTTTGQACFPVDLEGLSSLTALMNCDDTPVTLTNVNCDTGSVGFRIHYNGAPTFNNSFSVANDLTIECAECGTNSSFTMTDPSVDGAGNPCPGSHHCWDYTFTVENCTDSPLTNIKIQGGTGAWLERDTQTVSISPSSGWSITSKNTGKNNRVWTISGGSLAIGDSVEVTVHVCGTVGSVCDAVQYISGPWSATGTKTTDNSKVTTTHTGRASFFVDCSEDCQP
jgi:hypothetical protein